MVHKTQQVPGTAKLAQVVTQVEDLRQQMVKLLQSLPGEAGKLSDPVLWELKRMGQELEAPYGRGVGGLSFARGLERAADELGIGPANRVDKDLLTVHHGVTVLFRCFQQTKDVKGGKTEADRLIARFMKSHGGIEVNPQDTPWGARDSFTIEGTKADRVKFQDDPRWPKLQKALEDIYMAEYLPGYPADRPKRKIKDTTKFVFGE